MAFAFSSLRVGVPTRHDSLSVFPLFSDSQADAAYRLADEALADAPGPRRTRWSLQRLQFQCCKSSGAPKTSMRKL